jgi:hypothetical protein
MSFNKDPKDRVAISGSRFDFASSLEQDKKVPRKSISIKIFVIFFIIIYLMVNIQKWLRGELPFGQGESSLF